ncbi:hypothetical protein F66182_9211 [Fusarium sp. NRRL 66182]|nr:hypothetical protein F66182_9211 [Fusarium sp. NRRL 66182]
MNNLELASLDAFICRWLGSLTNSSSQDFQAASVARGQLCHQPRLDWGNIPTPPYSSSTPTRDRSSPKRARVDEPIDGPDIRQFATQIPDSDSLLDNDKTPNALTRARTIPLYNLSAIPSLSLRQPPSQSSTNASSHRSPSRASTNRSASPVKRSTLELLKKPLRYVPIEDDPTEQLPDDIASLFDNIISITLHREKFLPSSLRPELAALHRKGMIRPGWYFDVDDDEATNRYRSELTALCNFQEAAKTCKSEEAAEATWNLEVHAPLLKLAFDPFPSLRRDLLTAARISKPFLPEMQAATMYDYTRAKMVDLGVRICPPSDVTQTIQQALISLPDNQRCINQTVYGPVRKDPIAMVIETKIAAGDLEEARLQLGIWVASWHQRIKMLVGASSTRAAAAPIVTLPLIIVMEHKWRLLFACDRQDRIVSVSRVLNSQCPRHDGRAVLIRTCSRKSSKMWR